MTLAIEELRIEDAEVAVAIFADAITPRSLAEGPEQEFVDLLTGPGPLRERLLASLRRAATADRGGSWLAWIEREAVGVATAVRRDRFWGLSTFFVRPRYQGRGVGRQLLERVLRSAEGAGPAMIYSSMDPAAMRRYALAGFDLVPTVGAVGEVDRTRLSRDGSVRAGSAGDLALVDDVDVALRGGSRAGDVGFLLEHGARMLVVDGVSGRGFAVHYGGRPLLEGSPLILGATDVATAKTLLSAFLLEVDGGVRFHGWTAAHQWAIDVALAAKLTITPSGPLFLRGGDVPGGWIGSGIYF
jgi:GNAT superfamily N-acetyltransferase